MYKLLSNNNCLNITHGLFEKLIKTIKFDIRHKTTRRIYFANAHLLRQPLVLSIILKLFHSSRNMNNQIKLNLESELCSAAFLPVNLEYAHNNNNN